MTGLRKPLLIRERMLYAFLLVALLPSLLISATSLFLGYRDGRQQVLDRLESVQARKLSEFNAWIQSNRVELSLVLTEQLVQGRPSVVLDLAQEGIYYDFYLIATRKHFQRAVNQNAQLEEVQLVDARGRVVLSTDQEREGTLFVDQQLLQDSLQNDLAVSFPFSVAAADEVDASQWYVMIMLPVRDSNGGVVGAMAGRINAAQLIDILNDRTGLGSTGRTLLINDSSHYSSIDGMEMSSGDFEKYQALLSDVSAVSTFGNLTEGDSIGAAGVIPEMNTRLVVEQAQSEAFASILSNLWINLILMLGALFFAVLISALISRDISRPLGKLVNAAQRIAGGQLDQIVVIKTHDEIGILSETFNLMSAQLRELITDLENKVKQRTAALLNHAMQLESLAQISRELTAILDPDQLIERVVETLSVTFRYERVQLFLLDEKTDCFTAHTSLAGKQGTTSLRVLSQEEVQAALDHQNRITDDVGDSEASVNQFLMIPLQVGGRTNALIRMESDEPREITPEQKLILQSLGDQIAIALENARHYHDAHQLATMEERQRIARDMHDSVIQSIYSISLMAEGGQRLIRAGDYEGALEYFQDLANAGKDALKAMRLMMYELRPPVLEEVGLVGALQQRLDAVESRAGITARLLVPEKLEIPLMLQETLYFIAIEALNNALRHASASEILVKISFDNNEILMSIHDNGKGMPDDNNSLTGGMGLRNMRERIEKAGGSFMIQAEKDEGTMIGTRIEMPHE